MKTKKDLRAPDKRLTSISKCIAMRHRATNDDSMNATAALDESERAEQMSTHFGVVVECGDASIYVKN